MKYYCELYTTVLTIVLCCRLVQRYVFVVWWGEVMSVQELTDISENASNAVEVDQKGVNLAGKTPV